MTGGAVALATGLPVRSADDLVRERVISGRVIQEDSVVPGWRQWLTAAGLAAAVGGGGGARRGETGGRGQSPVDRGDPEGHHARVLEIHSCGRRQSRA